VPGAFVAPESDPLALDYRAEQDADCQYFDYRRQEVRTFCGMPAGPAQSVTSLQFAISRAATSCLPGHRRADRGGFAREGSQQVCTL